MFLRYQKLIVLHPNSGSEIEVNYLADYLGNFFSNGSYVQSTIIICQKEGSNIIYHIPANYIVGIIDGVI
jgi:hypothetical protein